MYKKIPGNNEFRINLKGDVINLQGETISLKRNRSGKVIIEMYGTKLEMDIRKLILLAWYELGWIPDLIKQLDNLQFQKVQSKVLRIACEYFPFFKEPIEYGSGFRYISTHPRYAIDYDGNVLDTATNVILSDIKRDDRGYETIRIYVPDRCGNRDTRIHRLKCTAWLPNDDYNLRPYINHIDGNPNNNHLLNLEWCSSQENNAHAADIGLNSCLVGMKVRDAVTGKITVYKSIVEMSRHLGMGRGMSCKTHLYKMPGYLYRRRYEIKQLDDESPWFYEKTIEPDSVPDVFKAHYLISVFDKSTGITTKYARVHQVIQKYNLGKIRSTNIELAAALFKEKCPNLTMSYKRVALRGPYFGINLRTKKRVVGNSLKEIALYIGKGFNELQIDLTRRHKYIYDNTWVVTTQPDKLQISEYIDKPAPYSKILVVRVSDNKEATFRSMSEVARRLSINTKTIRKCMDTGKSYKGMKFRALES